MSVLFTRVRYTHGVIVETSSLRLRQLSHWHAAAQPTLLLDVSAMERTPPPHAVGPSFDFESLTAFSGMVYLRYFNGFNSILLLIYLLVFG